MVTPKDKTPEVRIYFSEFFGVSPRSLADYGAFDVSCVVDLPLFVDPFLLFTSKKPAYQTLHDDIIKYLRFLRDKAVAGNINEGLLKAWFCFHEVHQNKFGFCLTGSRGSGLGLGFARALNENLTKLFANFGKEQITQGSHLEKLVLIRERVGRDNISDFTTNLIKGFLCAYTQTFALAQIAPALRRRVRVPKVHFDYEIEAWVDGTYELPWLQSDFVLLTPEDILTQDDTWINKEDLRGDFSHIREAMDNDALRAQIDDYFRRVLPKKSTAKDERAAVEKTLLQFPELMDWYIKSKEDRGEEAVKRSATKVRDVERLFIENLRSLAQKLAGASEFYKQPAATVAETRQKIVYLKQVIECQDGYRIFYVDGKPVEREKDLQILFKLVWEGSPSSVDTEVNNGRGAVDFKISRGAGDATLVEFKLAGNSQLEKNLEHQVTVYEKANKTTQSFKVILYFNQRQEDAVLKILKRLKVEPGAGVILIDARSDNKPSASKVAG